MIRSLRGRLATVWALTLLAALLLALPLLALYRQSATAGLDRAGAAARAGCAAIAARYADYAAGWSGPTNPADAAFRTDLAAVVGFALADRPGLIGGVWRRAEPGRTTGSAPGGPLTATAALPSAVRARLPALAGAVLATGAEGPEGVEVALQGGQAVLVACRLGGPVPDLAAYAVAMAPAAPGAAQLRFGLAGLLGLALGISLLSAWLIGGTSRRVGAIERALAAHEGGALPRLAPTGLAELDRIVAALNAAGARAEALAGRVAAAERLAALGRVAAGVAHEVRNPIAAMRLRAENALAASDPARANAALRTILEQVARLEALSGELLAMTAPRMPAPEAVALGPFLRACAEDHGGAPAGIAVATDGPETVITTDPALLRRVLDSLVDNAMAAGPPVVLRARLEAGRLIIAVSDGGAGVPEALRATLFEPFVTGRPDGTGLGLAIARELATALGGTVALTDPGGTAPGMGASFTLSIPAGESG